MIDVQQVAREFDKDEYIAELRAENARLRALVIKATKEFKRAVFCEASAEDGYGPRLRELREWLIEAGRALEGKVE